MVRRHKYELLDFGIELLALKEIIFKQEMIGWTKCETLPSIVRVYEIYTNIKFSLKFEWHEKFTSLNFLELKIEKKQHLYSGFISKSYLR